MSKHSPWHYRILDFPQRPAYTCAVFGDSASYCHNRLQFGLITDTPGTVMWRLLGTAPGRFGESEDCMATGTIARLLIDKGFGFIRDESGIEHFFHRSAVRHTVFELLREGQRVEFTTEESGKGPRAGDVRLIES